MSTKYSVNDYVSATCTDIDGDNEYSFGQIIEISNNQYKIKLIDNQVIQCDIKNLDTCTDIIPTKANFKLYNPFDIYDYVYDTTSYDYFSVIQKDPKKFMENKVTGVTIVKKEQPQPAPVTKHIAPQVWISKCRHGEDCERLGCSKGPKYCPHGEGCERMMCKALYY